MTDQADKVDVLADEQEPGKPAQRERQPWSPEDWRALQITVGGGLAANLATVIFVAVGVVIARQLLTTNIPSLLNASQISRLSPRDRATYDAAVQGLHSSVIEQRWFWAILTVVALVALVVHVGSWRRRRRRRRRRKPMDLIAFAVLTFVLLICGLAWLGFAAGIK